MTVPTLRDIRFFEAHPEFAIHEPYPFAYGRRATVDAERGTIGWWDARDHGVTVERVEESTADRLVVRDREGRRFVFAPLTAAFLRSRFPSLTSLVTDEDAILTVRYDGYDY